MTIGIEHVNDYTLIRFEWKFPIRRSLDQGYDYGYGLCWREYAHYCHHLSIL